MTRPTSEYSLGLRKLLGECSDDRNGERQMLADGEDILIASNVALEAMTRLFQRGPRK